MNDDRKRRIIRDIALAEGTYPQRDFEFTRMEYQVEAGCGESQARITVTKLHAQGKLKRRSAVVNGSRCYLYWRPEDETEDPERADVG